jgi:hypothetical protein
MGDCNCADWLPEVLFGSGACQECQPGPLAAACGAIVYMKQSPKASLLFSRGGVALQLVKIVVEPQRTLLRLCQSSCHVNMSNCPRT